MLKSLPQHKIPSFLTWPYFAEDEIAKAAAVLASGKVNYWTGQEGKSFEQEYADTLGVQHAIALMNGTVALEAALAALQVGPGDEVITTCRTYIASASCIVMRGATPVLADVCEDSQNITAATIEKVMTSRTKAIIVVHIAGWPCDMTPIMQLARAKNIAVIEDCAQAHGALYFGRPVGSLGDMGAFSFCQDKIITTGGEGGLFVTNQPALWEKAWSMKDHGKSYAIVHRKDHPPGFRWLHTNFGSNWRMTEMQAAIGRLQLKKLPTWHQLRTRNASILQTYLQGHPACRVPVPSSDLVHAYYKFYAFLRADTLKTGWSRDRVMGAINERGVPCYSGICSEIYLEEAFANLRPARRMPVAERLGETSLMFLVHPTLTEAQMHYAGQVIAEVMSGAMR